MATIRELESGKWQPKCVVEDRSLRPNHSTTTLMPCAGHAGSNRKLTEMFVDRSEAERTTVADSIDRCLQEVTPLK